MTREIVVNDKTFNAYQWHEEPLPPAGEPVARTHARDRELLENGVPELAPGEASFVCDQTLVFDTTFATRGDNRKFVVLWSEHGKHVAKPY